MKIKSKLLIIFSMLFMLFSIISIIINLAFARPILTKNVNQELINLTESITNSIELTVNSNVNTHLKTIAEKNIEILRSLYNQYQSGRMTEFAAKEMAEKILLSQKIGDTGYIFAWDTSRAPAAVPLAVHPLIKGKNVAALGFVQAAVKLKNGYMEYKWKNPGETIERDKAMYVAFFDKWNWLIAVSSYKSEFLRLFNLDELRKQLNKIKIKETGYPAVMDMKGTFVMHPHIQGKNLFNTRSYDGKLFIQEVIKNKNGTIYYDWKNPNEKSARSKIGIYRHIRTMDWIVWISLYNEEAYNLLTGIRNVSLFISLFSLCIVIPLIILISIRISKPIVDVASKLGIIAQSGDTLKLDIHSNDEIGSLAKSYNSVIDILQQTKEILGKVAQGDLTVGIQLKTEEGSLGDYLKKMISSLRTLISQVNSSILELLQAAQQITSNSQSLSQGASEQASSVEEMSSISSEINSQAKMNAENARLSSELSRKAIGALNEGTAIMSKLVDAMEKINVSAGDIKKIVKVIDDIAFQINLLALNANVEAARAGKFGKGFAVVADEVRNLAVKSSHAVQDTTIMVEEAIANVKNGNDFVTKMSSFLNMVLEGAKKAINLTDEVANASSEQARALEEIDSGLTQINDITQTTSANAEESASTSEHLAQQANLLKTMIEVFKIEK